MKEVAEQSSSVLCLTLTGLTEIARVDIDGALKTGMDIAGVDNDGVIDSEFTL